MKRLPMKPEMFAAWRERLKTVTRRLINPQPDLDGLAYDLTRKGWYDTSDRVYTPYYRPGETVCLVTRWAVNLELDNVRPSDIASTRETLYSDFWIGEKQIYKTYASRGKWRSPRFVPLHLEHHFPKMKILSVRSERLQEITDEDALCESILEVTKDGVLKKYCVYDNGDYSSTPWQDMPRNPVDAFRNLWNTIHKDKPWESNPMVWRVELAGPDENWRVM